ncbi:hypothetical protein AGABI1DRAFT_116006 [Agaricus bisporus var. burnettii JB137-S8]|uniref:Thaumatin-like protein n=1 Tax=Agaricus bisporus var. burnettii (strain JB137-S8 / ATCC MYA-4627 / FGSC 10392) TaxID=597362 RepID=K5XN96_AGABU|nr:uncharacterized protein AGABI1DRAFT_116006 [Agaricus bisporus var. burnettii JB137-S8]EKM76080.1 hypothetical protein AGABI1DRAFT_116006 [Agaricus bisporus var. burnettii JB137-S8]
MVSFVNLAFVGLALIAGVHADHQFTLKNNCGSNIQPVIANVNCGYSPRCDTPGSGGVPNPAISYNGPQPGNLGPGASQTLNINRQWNGRIFAQNGACGPKGESCTQTEFNLDTGNNFTPQAYDISNIQGFTQSTAIGVNGCETVTCRDVGCPCRQAYPPGDLSGCGNDSPVRGCSAGDHQFTITFCP